MKGGIRKCPAVGHTKSQSRQPAVAGADGTRTLDRNNKYQIANLQRPTQKMTLRLFWFLVGAGSATLWMKHHEIHKLDGKDKHRIECPANQPSVSLDECQRWTWSHRWDWHKAHSDWEDDRAKMVALSRQATDTVSVTSTSNEAYAT